MLYDMRVFIAFLALCTCTLAQVHTPAKGSKERAILLDAIRVPVQRELKQKVVFEVRTLRVQGPWAFFDGSPRTPSGGTIDFRKTKFRDAVDAGMFDDITFALLKKNGSKWKVLRFVIGPTDVAWIPWADEFHAPKAIFPQQ